MAKKPGQLDYSKDGAAYAYIDKPNAQGDKGQFAMQFDPRSNTLWAGMTAKQFADSPYCTPASGIHVGKDYIDKVEGAVGWFKDAQSGMQYAVGAASLKTGPDGSLPNPDNMKKLFPRAMPKTVEGAKRIWEKMQSGYDAQKAPEKAAEQTKQAEAPEAKAEPKTVGQMRREKNPYQADYSLNAENARESVIQTYKGDGVTVSHEASAREQMVLHVTEKGNATALLTGKIDGKQAAPPAFADGVSPKEAAAFAADPAAKVYEGPEGDKFAIADVAITPKLSGKLTFDPNKGLAEPKNPKMSYDSVKKEFDGFVAEVREARKAAQATAQAEAPQASADMEMGA